VWGYISVSDRDMLSLPEVLATEGLSGVVTSLSDRSITLAVAREGRISDLAFLQMVPGYDSLQDVAKDALHLTDSDLREMH
jgi:hypothetical protein